MPQYKTQELGLSLSKAFYDEIYYQKSRYFYFLGRVSTWGSTDLPAETVTLTNEYLHDTRREMVFAKRISPNEISQMIRRINWTSGLVYDQWDGSLSMQDKDFYVLTDEFKVYKCLNNNNNSVSTQQPTSSDVEPFTTSDGYVWKYMYTIPSFKRQRFLTTSYMPVQRSISESFYGIGSIEEVAVLTGGAGYTEETTEITVIGDGEGAVLEPVIYDGVITDIIVTAPGEGYTSASFVVTSTTGSGATLSAVISRSDYTSDQLTVEQSAISQRGKIYSVVVTNTGDNYTEFTEVTVEGNGTGCVLQPVIESGKITNILVLEEGSGYTYANVVITDPGRPFIPPEEYATAYAILPPESGHGANAVKELITSTVMISTPLRSDITIQGVQQDFRTFGVLKAPKNVYTGAEYVRQSELLAYTSTFSDVTGLVKDEVLLFEGHRYRVLEISGLTVYLMPLDAINKAPVGALVAQAETGREYTSLTTSNLVELDKYTGNLIYFSEQAPFEFAEDQSITVKTFLKF